MNLAIPVNLGRDDKYDINMAYPDYVSDAGYNPILVNPGNNLKAMAEMFDGLVLPGGIDIDPIPYGDNNWGSYYCNPKKDKFERELMWAFMTAGKPIFGICRGFQLIAREYMFNAADVHLGHVDTLYNDTEYAIDRVAVNSMHHQAVYTTYTLEQLENNNKIGPHVRALAWTNRGVDAEAEGVILEAILIENWSKAPIMGVQWHPEELRDIKLLQCFFEKFQGQPKETKMAAAG